MNSMRSCKAPLPSTSNDYTAPDCVPAAAAVRVLLRAQAPAARAAGRRPQEPQSGPARLYAQRQSPQAHAR